MKTALKARKTPARRTSVRKRATKTSSIGGVSPLIQAIKTPAAKPNVAFTENAALSLATTTSSVLDLFASGGAMRQQNEAAIATAFAKAFAEDKLLATKVAFYLRDIRGGQGERKVFRSVLKWLAANAPRVVEKNIELIPVYGRWDDLFVLFGTQAEKAALAAISKQFATDVLDRGEKNKSVSLLGKWLPSENASSHETRRLARKLIAAFGVSPRDYRKALSALRERIRVVERDMCANNWDNIDYEKVTSRALLRYRKAFPKHDPAGYAEWKGKAFAGKAKVHASTLYPYDIVAKVLRGQWDETLELQWRNLPDFFAGKIHSGLVVCDVSGSMTSWSGRGKTPSVSPLDIAISLAMYMGERMNGPFKNHFITFSERPQLQTISGASLHDKARNLTRANWDMNTDIQAVFRMILEKAQKSKLTQADLPDAIYIVSDLQFDNCGFNQTNFEAIKRQFQASGYEMPLLVFWQVRASDDKVALKFEKGVAMVSGFSPAALASILKLEQPKETTPMEVMLATVNTERYEPIRV